jgi:AcrR family transcriptional regulator
MPVTLDDCRSRGQLAADHLDGRKRVGGRADTDIAISFYFTGVTGSHHGQGTSLQDLLVATGLSKSSLFESFGNKQSLFEAAFTRYFDSRSQQMRERLQQAESPLDFIRGCLLSVLEDAQQPRVAACWSIWPMNFPLVTRSYSR